MSGVHLRQRSNDLDERVCPINHVLKQSFDFVFFLLGHLRDSNTAKSCHIKAVVVFFFF